MVAQQIAEDWPYSMVRLFGRKQKELNSHHDSDPNALSPVTAFRRQLTVGGGVGFRLSFRLSASRPLPLTRYQPYGGNLDIFSPVSWKAL